MAAQSFSGCHNVPHSTSSFGLKPSPNNYGLVRSVQSKWLYMATNSVSVSCLLMILPWSGIYLWYCSFSSGLRATRAELMFPYQYDFATTFDKVSCCMHWESFSPTEPRELVLLREWMNEWILFLSLTPQTAHVCTNLQCCHYSGNHTPVKTTGRTNSLSEWCLTEGLIL